MYNGKTIIGIIPARSGSKRLPHKNIRPFAGKPLIAWTIQAALESGVLDEVFVSTDSVHYASIARQYGANVPFLRPDGLAGDACPAGDCAVHAISEYRSRLNRTFDYFALLQPTCPLRTAAHIADGVRMVVDGGYASVVSFSPLKTDPRLICRLPPDFSLTDFSSPNNTLRQDAEQLYVVNGMLYICLCDLYEETKSFYGPGGKAMIIGGEEDFIDVSIDIDDETDFLYAEFMAKILEYNNTGHNAMDLIS